MEVLLQPGVCTVIVTVDADPDVVPELEAHARFGIEHFSEHPGYVGGALHRSADGRRLVQYLQWESEASYRDCMDDPRWDQLPSAARFLEHVSSGRAVLDARVFSVEAVS